MFDRWRPAVFSLMNSRAPISRLLRPSATRRSTSSSRLDRPITEPPEAAALAAHLPAATRLPATPLGAADLAGVDRVLKSPGLAPHDAGIAALLAAAAKNGVPVEGELDTFADALEGLRSSADYVPKVIAVTGAADVYDYMAGAS